MVVFAAIFVLPIARSFQRLACDTHRETILRDWVRIMERSPWEDRGFPRFRRDFQDLFARHLGFRRELVEANAKATIALFGESPSTRVVIGEDGWLFASRPGFMDDFRGLRPFSSSELDLRVAALESRRDYLARKGIPYLFVIAPNKHLVYPDKVPAKFNRVRTATQTDALLKALRESNPDFEVLDLLDSQHAARDEAICYYPLDTHWNYFGAYHAYLAIMAKLERSLPGIQTLSPNRIRMQPDKDQWRGMMDTMGILGPLEPVAEMQRYVVVNPTVSYPSTLPPDLPALEGSRYGLRAPTTYRILRSPGDKPRALLFRDSFSMALLPLLSEHFSVLVALWEDFDQGLLEEAVEKYQPDIVIEERLDRFLALSPQFTPDISRRLFGEAFEKAEPMPKSAVIREKRTSSLKSQLINRGTHLAVVDHRKARVHSPEVLLEPGMGAVLKLSVWSPTGGLSQIGSRVRGKESGSETQQTEKFWMPGGESDLFFTIPNVTERSKVRFQFRPFRKGDMVLRRMELRQTAEPMPTLAPDRSTTHLQ